MAGTTTLYKLIILKMLEQAASPLSGSQISEFILGKEYTNYFTLQQILFELQKAGLIDLSSQPGTSLFRITEAGTNTLSYFEGKLSDAILQDIRNYLKEKEVDIRNLLSVSADYFPGAGSDLLVRCRVQERTCTLIELTLSVPSEREAEAVCANWKEKNQDIYAYLMKNLL